MDPLQPGDPSQVGSYRLLGRLGAGGMGQVFLGRSLGGRPVAVKVIRSEHAGDGQFRDRFAREVEAARRVGGFHTAQVVDADPGADPPWLVTAYIPGPSLHEAVGEHGPLPAQTVRMLGAGLAEGLAAIHACGLVHRDLKPGNVLLAADGPRIIDFGIARTLDAGAITAHGAVMGTYAFMSPEQARGEQAGPASDVFSLGSVLAFAATGRSPFAAGSIPAIVHGIISEAPHLTELPGSLRPVVAACLAKDPTDRPAVAEALARLAGPVNTAEGWLPPPVTAMITERAVTTTAWSLRRKVIIGGAGLTTIVVLAGLGTVIYQISTPEQKPKTSITTVERKSGTSSPSPDATLPTGIPSAPPADVTWRLVPITEGDTSDPYGLPVPFSDSAGPRQVTGGVAAGYAHTPTGALIASAQIVTRAGYSAGRKTWEPTITRQFIPSPDRDRLLGYMRGQIPFPGPTVTSSELGQLAGYIYESYTPDTAVIGLVFTSADVFAFAVKTILKWRGNDWQMAAPPGGVWTSLQRRLTGMTGVIRWGPAG